MEYVAKLSGNEIARTVKLADLRHNSDLTRLDEIDDKARKRIKKYIIRFKINYKAPATKTKVAGTFSFKKKP